MSGVATAIAGAAVVGAVASNNAAKKGAKATDKAAAANAAQMDAQIAENRRQYDLARRDAAPWRNTGQRGLIEYGGLMGLMDDPFNAAAMERYRQNPMYVGELDQFEASPGYQFRRDEGLKAIERSALSRGMGRSGPTLKSLQRYGDGLAADEYNNYYNRVTDSFSNYANRLAGLAGIGQTTNQNLASLGANYSNSNAALTGSIANQNMQGAAARASGYMQSANNFNNMLNQGVGLYSMYQGGYFNNPNQPQSYGAGGGGGTPSWRR